MLGEYELVDVVKRHLSVNPEDSVSILEAITEGLKKYKSTVDNQRTWQARNAMSGMYSFVGRKAIGKLQRIFLMDALFISFPQGKINGHCGYDTEALHKYLYAYKQQVTDKQEFDKWLESTRGKEWVEWHDKLLENNC